MNSKGAVPTSKIFVVPNFHAGRAETAVCVPMLQRQVLSVSGRKVKGLGCEKQLLLENDVSISSDH